MSDAEQRRAAWGTHPDDAGLRAVARVRQAREEDARIGLQQARGEEAARHAAAAELQRQLIARRASGAMRAGEFVTHHAWVSAVGSALSDAEEQARAAGTVAGEAEARWRSDRARLEAMEVLLERRLTERREAKARAEARELDDIAGQQWARRRAAGGS